MSVRLYAQNRITNDHSGCEGEEHVDSKSHQNARKRRMENKTDCFFLIQHLLSLLNNDILYGSLQKRKNIKIFHSHTDTEWSMHQQ